VEPNLKSTKKMIHPRKVVVDLGAPFFIEKTCYLAE
jgi:hypothetical protein